MFMNREEAGDRLAEHLRKYRDDPTALILALPRGGVAVGYRLSLALGVPLDVLITRKIGAPGNPEYALGAVCETGGLYWNQEALVSFSLGPQDLEQAVDIGKEEIARRIALYRHGQPLPSITDKTVIVLDDGIATGATFLASIAHSGNSGPEHLSAPSRSGRVRRSRR